MVPHPEKSVTSGLTVLERSRRWERAKERDPDAYHLKWRLEGILESLDVARTVAKRNRHRWPVMTEEIEKAWLLVLLNLNTARGSFDKACDEEGR